MAFTSALIRRDMTGGLKFFFYSFTSSSGGTGGEITTPLKKVIGAHPVHETSEGATDILTALNSAADGQVTITTVADEVGMIMIYGH